MRKSSAIVDRVVLCLTPSPNFVEEIFAAFRKLYPHIQTEYIHETGGTSFVDFLSQLEKGEIRIDIMLLNDQQKEVLKVRGFIEKYTSPESATFPERAKDPDGYATQVFVNPFSVAYNTEKVRPEDVPASYEDLLSAKWRGRLLYPDPRVSGSGFGWFANLKGYLGMEFFRKLARQGLRCEPHPEEKLLEGDNAILVAGMINRIEKMREEGKPVDWVPLPVIWFAGPFAVLFRQAEHPLAGKRLIDFLLSFQGQEIIGRYYLPNRPGVPIEDKVLENVQKKLAGSGPAPFDEALGRHYLENQEEAFRLLLPSPK